MRGFMNMKARTIKLIGTILFLFCISYIYFQVDAQPDGLADVTGMAVAVDNTSGSASNTSEAGLEDPANTSP